MKKTLSPIWPTYWTQTNNQTEEHVQLIHIHIHYDCLKWIIGTMEEKHLKHCLTACCCLTQLKVMLGWVELWLSWGFDNIRQTLRKAALSCSNLAYAVSMLWCFKGINRKDFLLKAWTRAVMLRWWGSPPPRSRAWSSSWKLHRSWSVSLLQL